MKNKNLQLKFVIKRLDLDAAFLDRSTELHVRGNDREKPSLSKEQISMAEQ